MTFTGRLDAFLRIGIFDNVHFSAESKVVPAHGKALIDTQLSIAVPIGTYGRVAPRSGLGGFSFFSSRL
jgi:hypothetical protein